MINYSLLSFSSSICIYVLFFSSTTFASTSNETDLKALLQFKAKITHDPLQILSSWNQTIHFCQWQGITCGHLHRRVTGINLQSLNLAGSISPYIANLTFLKNLNLENNSFSSQIPNQVSHLRRLQELRLNDNSISGRIPSNISSLSNLIIIRLDNNKLEGDIPAEFGSLSKLQTLSLFKNKLSGTIPHSLGNLSQLQKLGLDSNEFVGNIPYSLGHLRSLKALTLFLNRFSGNAPPSIFNLSSLELLDIGENHLQGDLPSDIGFSLPKISSFAAFSNELTGKFPSSFSNASNLELLSLNTNKFTGQVPSLANLNKLNFFTLTSNYLGNGNSDDDLSFLLSLTNATMLRILCINGNNFGGTIPRAVGNLSISLEVFLLDNNQIIGNLPSDIGNLGSLQDFEVQNNKLSGFIPDSIGKLQNLGVLLLNNNMFSGKIPFSFGNLTNLIQFDASQNNLWGNVPPILGKCENLLLLNLSFNKFRGSIPAQILNLSSLSIYLDLSKNNFTGTLPVEVGNLKNLGAFDVSGNKLSGEIPSSLGGCTSMEILNMYGNRFQGSIPSSLSSLKALQALDLSGNNLSGEIPEFLPLLHDLLYLNLSHNNLEGKVPTKGIFQNASSTSVEGNNMLCGGIPKFHLPPCNSSRHKKNGLTLKLKLVISFLCVFSGVTLVSVILFLFGVKQKIKKKPSSSNLSDKKFLELSYQTLCKATNGFSSENLVGKGYFGSVYKGTLDAGTTFIAIKVFNLMNRGALESFSVECEALRNIRHRNVVKVITACSSIDYEGNDFKALIYEFIVNGSLDEWLHPNSKANEEEKGAKKLNIVQRLSIAIDIAHALDYLHNHCETPIVHCDLKPSNVLLDQQLIAHIGDFGLAKFLPFQSIHQDNESCSIGVKGTVGYTPPEYGMGSEVSTCGDLYSYGVILLEMFTGKRPTDEMFSEDLNLRDMVKLALPNNKVVETVDPNIVWEKGKASRKIPLECLISILQIGVDCCAESARDRMSIGEVIGHLTVVKGKLVRGRDGFW